MRKYKVAYVTGSRADYGIVRSYLALLASDSHVDFGVIVTGSLLEQKYNKQIKLIQDDGFNILKKIKLPLDTTSNKGIIHSMACALDEFGAFFAESPLDLIVILGDRYEMMSVAIAAAMQRLPILHIHGGEATYANYDEFIRHSITKMSQFHITATEAYRKRVIQLGELPERVFNLGALGAENCCKINDGFVDDFVKSLEYKKYFVVLFHPETLSGVDVLNQIKQLLYAVDDFKLFNFVFIGTNADTDSDVIRAEIKKYVDCHSNAYYVENLHPDSYHYLLKNSLCLIGNSSSGIIEAPTLGIMTINIGDRQKGRVRANSVIDVVCDRFTISKSINDVVRCNGEATQINNPYYKKDAANSYYKVTMDILNNLEETNTTVKSFYDI